MIDGRKLAQRKRAEKNIQRVSKWIEDNGDGSRAECAKELNLSYWTVCRIVKELNNKASQIKLKE